MNERYKPNIMKLSIIGTITGGFCVEEDEHAISWMYVQHLSIALMNDLREHPVFAG